MFSAALMVIGDGSRAGDSVWCGGEKLLVMAAEQVAVFGAALMVIGDGSRAGVSV